MRVTRRFLAVAGGGVFLGLLGWILSQPGLLVGGSVMGAWVLAHQYAFLVAVGKASEEMAIEQTVAPDRPLTDQPISIDVSVSGTPKSIETSVTIRPPVTFTSPSPAERTISIGPETDAGTTITQLRGEVAGAFQFGRPLVTLRDGHGLFEERIELGNAPTVTVRPRIPRNIHIGEGGEAMATPYGSHPAGRGAGLEPAEIRQYVPGDPAKHIDWNATARLNDAFVREFEAETDRETVLLLDIRPSMTEGPPGQRKLDFAREVALGVVGAVEDVGDPLGLYIVDESGIGGRLDPMAKPERYPIVRRMVQDVPHNTGQGEQSRTLNRGPGFNESVSTSPADARRKANRLSTVGSPLARIRPFLESSGTYVERLSGNPLFTTAMQTVSENGGHGVTVLVTDDDDPVGVSETVDLLRRHAGEVLVFLTPTVLFEPGGLGDLDAAFDRYLEFEHFRRDLHSRPGVTAREVAPGDRLDAVLRQRKAATVGGGTI